MTCSVVTPPPHKSNHRVACGGVDGDGGDVDDDCRFGACGGAACVPRHDACAVGSHTGCTMVDALL